MATVGALAASVGQSLAVIPFGQPAMFFGRTVNLHIADVDIGILYMLAVTSLAVYGLIKRPTSVKDPERFAHPKLDGTWRDWVR